MSCVWQKNLHKGKQIVLPKGDSFFSMKSNSLAFFLPGNKDVTIFHLIPFQLLGGGRPTLSIFTLWQQGLKMTQMASMVMIEVNFLGNIALCCL